MASILLVDNEKDIRDFASRFFRERNFQVFSAATGADALAAVRQSKPDIVLLELKMKDMDGMDVLMGIMAESRSTKVVVVSSLGDIGIKDKAKRLGAASYLTKPVALSELVDIVLNNLRKQKRFFRMKKGFT